MAVKLVDSVSNPLHCVGTSYELAEQRLFSAISEIFPLKFKQSHISINNATSVLLTISKENTLRCIDVNTLVMLGELVGHTDIVMDVEFAKTSPFTVWSCGLDGTVRCWDLRTNLNEITFQALEEDKLLSVSLSLDDQLVCGGSESVNQDDEEEVKANMYIWDVKMKDYYQVYNEVFAESIDHVVFHPSNKPLLLAGCRDGLVYLFDVREKENNACMYVLNAEAGVSQIDFFSPELNIYCLTDEGNVLLWESNEGNELCKYPKSKLGKESDDVIDCFYDQRSEKLIAAVGNEKGDIEMVILNENGKSTPWFSLLHGHEAGVRAICWNFVSEKIITSCEDGMVALWKPKVCVNGET